MLGKITKWIMYSGSLKSESKFKYLEYYNSTNRYDINPASNIKDALNMEIPKPVYDDTNLFNLIKTYLESE
jgi:predicted AAA+ superfamily ATPase